VAGSCVHGHETSEQLLAPEEDLLRRVGYFSSEINVNFTCV
jgi:hypothetical protein